MKVAYSKDSGADAADGADKVRLLHPAAPENRHGSVTGGQPLEILAMLRTPEVKEAVIDSLTGIDDIGVRAGQGEITKLNLQTLVDTDSEVLLLDVDVGDAKDIKQLEELKRLLPPNRAIVVTSSNPTVEGMRSLMRLGIADLIPQPIQRNDILRALATAVDRKPKSTPSSTREGRAICFLSVCGGMGATTLAVQSACALAIADRKNGKGEKSKAENDANVCILDLDIQLGNAALYLDLASKSSVMDLHSAVARLDGSMLRGAMAHHRCGVDVLAAPVHVQPLDELTAESVMRMLLIARREYQNIMIDMPPVWTRWTRALIRAADMLVLVLQPSVPAVRQAKRQLDTLFEEGLEDVVIAPVMNRVLPQTLFRRQHSEVTMQDASTALGRKIPYSVPNDYGSMIEAINHGLPLYEVKGGQTTAKRIAENINNIVAQIDEQQSRVISAR